MKKTTQMLITAAALLSATLPALAAHAQMDPAASQAESRQDSREATQASERQANSRREQADRANQTREREANNSREQADRANQTRERMANNSREQADRANQTREREANAKRASSLEAGRDAKAQPPQ